MHAAKEAHGADARGVGLSGGWRAGKSLFSGMEGVTWLPYAQLIWLIGVDYDVTRQEFIYLSEAGVSTGLVNPSDVRLPLNKYQPCALQAITGCIVETRTLADYRKIAARPPDLVIVCEPGLVDNLADVMELLWGRVSEKRGCIVLAGTSDEASEEWYQLWSNWQAVDEEKNPYGGRSFSIPTWQNTYRYPRGRNEPDFVNYEKAYGKEALMAHYGGVPASPRNLVLRNYWHRDIHVSDDVEFVPGRPTELTVDPNYSLGHRYSVEVIQWDEGSGDIWVVDEVAVEGLTHDEVIAECQSREWWPYVMGGTIDPYAGESHVYGSNAPNYYWDQEGVKLRTTHRMKVATMVQVLKEAMAMREGGGTRLHVSPRCERLIWEAARWRQSGSGQPSKENCDAIKALGYWLLDRFADERIEAVSGDVDNIAVAREWSVA